ncbi:MAG: hypothetical protein F6J90_30615 [Moorea sp. SIOASIH]|uniref:hypothetical protein n=1 Tax=Moorena sp. SIOASIH TaxID=2607817 RepID=UPI0013B633D5|nr:hypothetical protein [Moorena sp. SIOASIH]NEO40460.1 hypothetical protein [Moorena sp. SIOASIH]
MILALCNREQGTGNREQGIRRGTGILPVSCYLKIMRLAVGHASRTLTVPIMPLQLIGRTGIKPV